MALVSAIDVPLEIGFFGEVKSHYGVYFDIQDYIVTYIGNLSLVLIIPDKKRKVHSEKRERNQLKSEGIRDGDKITLTAYDNFSMYLTDRFGDQDLLIIRGEDKTQTRTILIRD